VSVIRDDYPDLCAGEAVDRVTGATRGVAEFLDRSGLDDRLDFAAPDRHLAYHGHCHAKALGFARHPAALLRRAGYAVDVLDSGCCGMAGAFGYRADHYDLSLAVGETLCETVAESPADDVVATGGSCRTQLDDLRGDRPDHPLEALAAALAE